MTDEPSYPSLGDDLDVAVIEDDGRKLVVARLQYPAELCYRKFCDATAIPSWLWVVGTAIVQSQDAAGRPLEVDFIGSLERASISYRLLYSYDDARREVSWEPCGGSRAAMAGTAQFVPLDDGSCQLRYSLHTRLADGLPPWADELYRKRPAETVVIDFCEWIDGELGSGEPDAGR